jgi:hypothetical protein
MALKAPLAQVVPLCFVCHGVWDGRLAGPGVPFASLNRFEKYDLAARWVETTQAKWSQHGVRESEAGGDQEPEILW